MLSHLRAQLTQWIQQRHKASELELSHQNIYILPSKDGVFFIAVATLNFVLGINYQNNLILAVSYMMAIMMTAALFMGFFNLYKRNVRYVSALANFYPYPSKLSLKITGPKAIQSLRVQTQYEEQPHCFDEVSSSEVIELNIAGLTRGHYPINAITLCSYFPFGLVKTWSYLCPDDAFYIYPEPSATPLTTNQYGQQQNEKSQRVNSSESSPEFDHLKEYQNGMSLSRVAWKQYAKSDKMLIKHSHDNFADPSKLVFDYSRLSGDKEERLSQLCRLIVDAEKRQQPYALYLQQHRFAFGQGPDHKKLCLEALSEF